MPWSQYFGCGIGACRPAWIENAYEYMASCGQGCWYHDETTNILYYIPRAGENMATVPVARRGMPTSSPDRVSMV